MPIRIMEAICLMSGFCIMRTLLKISRSFAAWYRKSRVTIDWAATVAIAAPITSISGNGPMPKISAGSKTIFTASPLVVAKKADLLFPIAVNMPAKVWLRKEKTTSPHVICRYPRASAMTEGLLRLKKPIRGAENRTHTAPNKSPKKAVS